MSQLTIVSGKGGVGKTTIAAALALGIAGRGQRTALVCLENADQQHPVFGMAVGYEPVKVPLVDARPSASLELIRIEAVPAVREYVRRKLPFGRLYEGVFDSRAFRDFTGATPGFEELMVLGKLYDLITSPRYDRVIFDAPASGHLRQLLSAPAAAQAAVRFGPLFDIAKKIERRLRNVEQCRLLLPALAEEMPLRESAELAAFVADKLGMPVQLVLNRLLPPSFSAQDLEQLASAAQAQPALSELAARCVLAANRYQSQQAALAQAASEPGLGPLLEQALRLPVEYPAPPASGDERWAFHYSRLIADALSAPLINMLDAPAVTAHG